MQAKSRALIQSGILVKVKRLMRVEEVCVASELLDWLGEW